MKDHNRFVQYLSSSWTINGAIIPFTALIWFHQKLQLAKAAGFFQLQIRDWQCKKIDRK